MALILLVLASALLHAAWNAMLRREPDKVGSGLAMMIACLLASAAVAAVSLAMGGRPPQGTALLATIGAGLCEAGYMATLFHALGRGPLGVSYTISRGGAIVVAWPLSILLLDERVGGLGLAGAAILLAGLLVIGLERGASRSAIAWSTACAVFVAGYHLFYKAAVGDGSPSVVVSISLTIAVAANLALLHAGSGPRVADALRKRAAIVVPAGIASCASFLLVLYALQHGGAAMVLTLRHVSVVFAALIGWSLGERPTGRQLAGAALVAAGAVVLGLGRES